MSTVSTETATSPRSIRSIRRKPAPSLADLEEQKPVLTVVTSPPVRELPHEALISQEDFQQAKPYALYADTTNLLSGYVRDLTRVPTPKDHHPAHYQRRAEANAFSTDDDDIPATLSPISFGPHTSLEDLAPSNTPPLIQDGSSDDHSSSDSHILDSRFLQSSERRQTRFLLPKKPSYGSLASAAPSSHSSSVSSQRKRLSASMIGRPLPLPPMSELAEKPQAPPSGKPMTGLSALKISSSVSSGETRGIKTFDITPAPELDPTVRSDVGPSKRIQHPYAYAGDDATPKAKADRKVLRKSATSRASIVSETWGSSSAERLLGRGRSRSTSEATPSVVSDSAIYANRRSTHSAVTLPKLSFLRRSGSVRSRSARSATSVASAATPAVQSEWALPSPVQLARASLINVISESGIRVPFGSLFIHQRTIVIFIRHFWCSMCQDYMSSLTSLVEPHGLYRRGTLDPINLVIIGNGSEAFITKYRQMFSMPFHVYTDPTLKLYEALGMGTIDETVSCNLSYVSGFSGANEVKRLSLEGNGYAKRGKFGGITMVVLRALKVGFPVWEKGGDTRQLGGEFIIGPGLNCSFAHRMQITKGHAPILDILNVARGNDEPRPASQQNATSLSDPIPQIALAVTVSTERGVTVPEDSVSKPLVPPPKSPMRVKSISKKTSTQIESEVPKQVEDPAQDDETWKESRNQHLNDIREKKAARRGGSLTGSEVSAVLQTLHAEENDETPPSSEPPDDAEAPTQKTRPEIRSMFSERDDGDDLVVLFDDRRRVDAVYAYAY